MLASERKKTMGRSFTSNHILNADKLTKAQFKKKFNDMMKAKGYTKADADEAELSYALAFSSDRKWVTVLTEDGDNPRNETADFAKSLGMEVLVIELVDSDFAAISLFDKTGTQADTMFLGDPYFDEVPEPSPLKWQTLLGIDWAQVEKILNTDYTFAEDALGGFAEIIGMDKENILLEYDEIDDSAVMLYFKKEGEKKLTLNAAFKQVFGAKLESRGFKLIKGGCMYVRVLNSEIVQFVTVEKEETYRDYLPVEKEVIKKAQYEGRLLDYITEYTCFNVVCSLKTLYENELPLKVTPFTYFMSNRDMCFDVPDFDKERASEIRSFTYQTDNSESLRAAMEYALEISKEIMLPLLDSVNNVDKYVLFLKHCYFSYDVYYKSSNYHDIIKSDYEKAIYNIRQYIERDYTENVEERIDAEIQRKNKYYDKLLGELDDTANDPVKFAKVLDSMENNKRENLEILEGYGIKI